jgi:DNA-binding NarL/FixJ family response regulator
VLKAESFVTRVLIVAAAPALRAGLRALLGGEDIQVVGEAAALEMGSPAPQADVILLADAERLADIAQSLPSDARLGLVVLSEEPRAAAVLRALPLAGWALLTPETSSEELRASVRAAAAGLVTSARGSRTSSSRANSKSASTPSSSTSHRSSPSLAPPAAPTPSTAARARG